MPVRRSRLEPRRAPLFERRLAALLERRSGDTSAHQRRIARLAGLIAREIGWSEEDRQALELGASTHDIGKLALPRRVLWKPGALRPVERRLVQTHTVIGALLLYGRRGAGTALARSIALHHHERWDGRGYPRRLAGDQIPESARIVAVADVYDALTHTRVYRPAFPAERALEYMRAQTGHHFDPGIMDCFLDLQPRFRALEAAAT